MENSPAVSDEANTPDKRVNSTPSTERSKASQLPTLWGHSQESSNSSSSSSSESGSSSSEDSDSSKSDSRHSAHKKRQVSAERDTSNNTPPKHEGDEYVHFDMETKARHKLDLTKSMVKYGQMTNSLLMWKKNPSMRQSWIPTQYPVIRWLFGRDIWVSQEVVWSLKLQQSFQGAVPAH